MEKECWCVRVHRSEGEQVRKTLLETGFLERSCKIKSEGDNLFIPVNQRVPGSIMVQVSCMPQKKELPRFEQVGGIAIMQDDDLTGAAEILASKASFHSVLYAESAVEGEFRVKKFKILAGKKTTATEYIEYGHQFSIDLSHAYFSARLSGERQRVLQMMKKGECVIDMFAGVGPFAIILADKASKVYAGDINPNAIMLMIRNISKNHSSNVIPILADALHLPDIIPVLADRIIMNLPLTSRSFLKAAFCLCKPGGVIHLYALVRSEDECLPLLSGFPLQSVQSRFVRSYSPDQFHMVYDITRNYDNLESIL